jgi:hypothetical protein
LPATSGPCDLAHRALATLSAAGLDEPSDQAPKRARGALIVLTRSAFHHRGLRLLCRGMRGAYAKSRPSSMTPRLSSCCCCLFDAERHVDEVRGWLRQGRFAQILAWWLDWQYSIKHPTLQLDLIWSANRADQDQDQDQVAGTRMVQRLGYEL